MFDPITMALVGSAIGGLMNKKDPLKGAILGAAGGYAAPGLLGAAGVGSAGAAGGATTGGLLGADAVGAGMASMAEQSAINSAMPVDLMGGIKTAAGAAKPVGEAAMYANAAGGLLGLGKQQMPQSTPLPQTGTGAQTLTAIANQGDQQVQAQMRAEEERRLARRKMIQSMGVA